MPVQPAFFYDVFSPYAYLAAERIEDLVPDAEWMPIEVFTLFRLNGRTSWVFSDQRRERMGEIEQRAADYGLPPVRWPERLPSDLHGMATAATVAKRDGRERPFSLGVLRAVYAHGIDASTPRELGRIAEEVGLDPQRLLSDRHEPAVEADLQARVEKAHRLGVPGVPSLVVGGEVFWGDDRLAEAAAVAARL